MPNKLSFKDPRISKRIYKLVTEGMPYSRIPEVILKEHKVSMTRQSVKKIYDRFIAKSDIIKRTQSSELNEAESVMDSWDNRMRDKFKQVDRAVTKLMETINEVAEYLPAQEYLKLAPTILATCREILNQLEFLRKEQDSIKVQQKNLIYSPMQIIQILNKNMNKLEKEGKIIIIPEGKRRTEKDKEKLLDEVIEKEIKEEIEKEGEIVA